MPASHGAKGDAMTRWTSDELTRIGTATELQLVSRRRDGTMGNPRTIWVVRVGGVDKDVTFADADPGLNDAIDAAYRDKYRRYGERIIGSVVNPEAQAATIKLVPR